MIARTKRPPKINGQRSGVTRLAKFSTNTIKAAPTIGPESVPTPPMMAMHMGKKDVPTPRWVGEIR